MSAEGAEEHYKWTYEENPLTPFNVQHQSERAKCLEWITENVKIQVADGKEFRNVIMLAIRTLTSTYLGRMPNVIVHEGLETYTLSNLTMIAAQYDKLKNATNALSKLGNLPNEGDLKKPESSNGRLGRDKKDDSFSVVIRKYCILYK